MQVGLVADAELRVSDKFQQSIAYRMSLVPAVWRYGLKLCDEYGIAQERTWVTPALGWALAKTESHEAGIAKIQAGLAAERAAGSEIGYPQFFIVAR